MVGLPAIPTAELRRIADELGEIKALIRRLLVVQMLANGMGLPEDD